MLITFGGESHIGASKECINSVSYFDPAGSLWDTMAVVKGTLPNQAFNAVALEYDIYITGKL